MQNIKKNEQFHLINLEENYFCFLRNAPKTEVFRAPIMNRVVPELAVRPNTAKLEALIRPSIPTIGAAPSLTIQPSVTSPFAAPPINFPNVDSKGNRTIPIDLKAGDRIIKGKNPIHTASSNVDDYFWAATKENFAIPIGGEKELKALGFDPKDPSIEFDGRQLSFLDKTQQIPAAYRRSFEADDCLEVRQDGIYFGSNLGNSDKLTKQVQYNYHDGEWFGDRLYEEPLSKIDLFPMPGFSLRIVNGKTYLVLDNLEGKILQQKELPTGSRIIKTKSSFAINIPIGNGSTQQMKLSKFLEEQTTDASRDPVKMGGKTGKNRKSQWFNPDGTAKPPILKSSNSQQTNGAGGGSGTTNTSNDGSCSSDEALFQDPTKDSGGKTFKERFDLATKAKKDVVDFKKVGKTSSEDILKAIDKAEKAIQDLDNHPLAQAGNECYALANEKVKELRKDFNLFTQTLDKLHYSTVGAKDTGGPIEGRMNNNNFRRTAGISIASTILSSIGGFVDGGAPGALLSGGTTAGTSLIPIVGTPLSISTGLYNFFTGLWNAKTRSQQQSTSTTPTTSASPSATPSASATTAATPAATASPAPIQTNDGIKATPWADVPADEQTRILGAIEKLTKDKPLTLYELKDNKYVPTGIKIDFSQSLKEGTMVLSPVRNGLPSNKKEDLYYLGLNSEEMKQLVSGKDQLFVVTGNGVIVGVVTEPKR